MAGSYLKSLQLAKQLEKKAKEASKKKAETESKLEKAGAIIEFCKKINAEIDDIEKILAEATAALNSKDYDLGLSKADKALETGKKVFIDKIHSIVDSADEMIELISEVGGDTKQIDSLKKNIDSALGAEDFEKGIKLAGELWDGSQKALHEQYANAYSRAQQILLKAKKQGEMVEDLESDLLDTKSQIDSENYAAAMSTLRNVIETASDLLKSHISSKLDSLEDGILSAEDLGADTSRISNYISKARKQLASGDFDEAMNLVKRAENECEKTISGKLTKELRAIKDEIRITKKYQVKVDDAVALIDDAAKAVKENEVSSAMHIVEKARKALRDAQFQAVLQAIAHSKDRLILAKKLDVDISNAINLLNESRNKLQKGDFEDAINAAYEAEKEIEKALSAFNEAKEVLEKLIELDNKVEEADIQLPATAKFVQDAKDALAKKDFTETIKKADAGIKSIKKLTTRAADEQIAIAGELITLLRQLNTKVKEADRLLREATEKLGEDNPIEAYKNALGSIEAAKQGAKKFFNDNISSLNAFLDDLSSSFDISDYKAQLEYAQDLFEQANIQDAFNTIEEIKKGVKEKGADECRKILGQCEAAVDELEAAEIDAADLRLMITKAEELFQKEQYDNAAATAKEAIQDAKSRMETLAKKSLFMLKKSLADAHADSINTSKWRSHFKESKRQFDAGDYSGSYKTSTMIHRELEKVKWAQQNVSKKIEKCEELLEEAKKNRVDIGQFSDELGKAKKALSSLNFQEAMEIIETLEKNLENALAMYLAAKLILSVKSSIDFADREGMAVETTKNSLNEAKALMKERKYEAALEIIKQVQGEINNAIADNARNKIDEIQALIADARNVGVDVSRPEKLLEKAQTEFDEGDFETSLKSALVAEGEINQVKGFSSKSATEIKIARDRIRDAEAIGLDMRTPRTLLEQSVDSLNSHKYAISFELSRKAGTQALDIIKRNLELLLDGLAKKISSIADQGVDVERPKSLLAEARNAFGTAEFRESIKLLMKSEQEIDRAELQYSIAMNALNTSKDKLKTARAEGLNIAKAEEMIADADKSMAERQYARVIELSISLGDEIERAKSRMDNCHLDLNALKERMERLRRIGLEIKVAEDYLKSSEEALHDGNFVLCREKCIEGERAISVELEKIVQDKIERAEELIENAVMLGIRDSEYRDMLDVAQTSASEGLWDFAIEQVQKCIRKIGEDIEKSLRKSIDEIKSKGDIIKKTGASTGAVDEKLDHADICIDKEMFDEAFKAIIDAEGSISTVESKHKDYLDARYAAESAISTAKKFGIPTKESDRLLAMADIEQERDYESAIELVREAAESAKNSLEQFNPNLGLSIKSKGLMMGTPGKITLEIKNRGKALAKDLEMEVSGNLEVKELSELPEIRGGESKSVEIEAISNTPGEIEISVILRAKRLFDGRVFEFEEKAPVIVSTGGPTAKHARATEIIKCCSCNGKIKPGFDIVICEKCQSVEHLACAKRTNRCGNCSATLILQ